MMTPVHSLLSWMVVPFSYRTETLLRQKKNEAILTIMTVAEELGDSEILDSVDKMKEYLQTVLVAKK